MNARDYTPALRRTAALFHEPTPPATVAAAFEQALRELGLPKPPRNVTRAMLESVISVLALRWAEALERMIVLLGEQPKGLSFQAAFEQALREKKLTKPPAELEQGMLLAAFEIVSTGRIPGAPDA